MSSSAVPATPAPGPATRRLGATDTVVRLVDAAVEEVRAEGYDGLTVRGVARRAGVAPATAYTYFGSKDHLVAESFWRRLEAIAPVAVDAAAPASERVAAAIEDIGELVAAEPALASASTSALMADDPNVRMVRDRVGLFFHQRLSDALGDDASAPVLRALDLTWMGAMVLAGTQNVPYTDVTTRVAEVAGLLLDER
jgi:AcrR family transcriptional regulator